jgi:hypothetical protein
VFQDFAVPTYLRGLTSVRPERSGLRSNRGELLRSMSKMELVHNRFTEGTCGLSLRRDSPTLKHHLSCREDGINLARHM